MPLRLHPFHPTLPGMAHRTLPPRSRSGEDLEAAQRAWARRWDGLIGRMTQLFFVLLMVALVIYLGLLWDLVEPALFLPIF